MYRIAIVEDEDIYINEITEYIQRYSGDESEQFSVEIFHDGDEITAEYRADFDIIFMDIQMSFVDGMAAAQEIRKVDSEVVIIFITNRTDYAIKGYEVDALDYMVKPVAYPMFAAKLKKAIMRLKSRGGQRITLSTKSGMLRLDADNIIYVESYGHRLEYHTADDVVSVRGSMSEAEEELLQYGFYRINRGYLVNMQHIDGVDEKDVLVGKLRLPIARGRRNEFLSVLNEYISRTMR